MKSLKNNRLKRIEWNIHIGLCLLLYSLMWTTAAVAQHQASLPQNTNWSDIHVSLSLYLTSIGGTAWFTWMLARYERSRSKKVDQLEQQLKMLIEQLEDKNIF